MSIRLLPVFCPDCHSHVTTVALEGSPQFVKHQTKFMRPTGQRVNCRHSWVVAPDARTGDVRLTPVDGRHHADEVLRVQTSHWLEHLNAVLGDDAADVVGSEVAQ